MNSNTGTSTAPLSQVRPNFLLIALGIVFATVPVAAFVAFETILPPPLQALLISGAMVLILYGLYPVPAMQGTFGKLSVAGPAAIGIFVFLFVWNSLAITSDRRYLVLRNVTDSQLNTRLLPNGASVTLLDVDSLSDDKLVSVLDAVKEAIRRGHPSNANEIDQQLEALYRELIQFLTFASKQSSAMELFQRYRAGDSKVDDDWEALVKQVAMQQSNPQNYLKRIKREPFALVTIEQRGKSHLELVLPGKPMVIGGQSYSVPIIANPALTVSRGIEEAIVIQLRE